MVLSFIVEYFCLRFIPLKETSPIMCVYSKTTLKDETEISLQFIPFDFPETVLILFLTSWLSWIDFVNFDTAISQKKSRRKYCNTIQNRQTIFSHCTKNKDTKRLIDWLSAKGVSIRTLLYNTHTPKTMVPDSRSEKYVYSRVKTLELGDSLSYHTSAVVLLFKDSVETIRCAARNVYNFDSVEFTDALALCPNLTEVDGAFNNAMSDGMLQRLVKQCPRLRGLGVGGGSSLTDMVFVRYCSSQLPLRRIDFSGSSLTGVSVMAALSAVSGSQFEQIAVANCRKVNDEVALKLAHSSGALLTDLNIASTEISAIGLKAVLCWCVSLSSLNIAAVTGPIFVLSEATDYRMNLNLTWLDVSGTAVCNQGLEIVAACYPRLRHLNMHDCSGVSDEGVSHLALSLSALTFLDIGYTTRYSYPAVVVARIDHSLADLVRANPAIQVLKLARRVISIAPLNTALMVSDGLLSVLNLANCLTGITDDEVVQLTCISPALRVVDFTDCSALTDVVLNALVTNCIELREVNLTGCKGLTLAGTAGFAKNCRKLVKLTH